MKSTVAAAVALFLAMAATAAPAGVVISQDVVTTNSDGSRRKSVQTVMVQDHKQKIITSQREVLIDLDAGKMYILRPDVRQFLEVAFPPGGMFARMMAREGLFVTYTKVKGTHKVAGYECQDYIGSQPVAISILTAAECVASDAPGAKEFVAFRKSMAEKLKGTPLAIKGEIPDGVPVSYLLKLAQRPFKAPPGMPAEQARMMEKEMAKYKPVTTGIVVTKIEVKDLPADTFTVPADYSKHEIETPHILSLPEGAAPASPAPAAPAPQ